MTWSYSGNPSASDTDKYRFLIGDTNENEPILSDQEIEYVVATYTQHTKRLYVLFDRAADFFARAVKRSLGPQSEDPTERQKYFAAKALYYSKLSVSASGFTAVDYGCAIFTKGMHDNVQQS